MHSEPMRGWGWGWGRQLSFGSLVSFPPRASEEESFLAPKAAFIAWEERELDKLPGREWVSRPAPALCG